MNWGRTCAHRVTRTFSVLADVPSLNVTRAVTVWRRGPVALSGNATDTVLAFAATSTVRTRRPLTEKVTRRTLRTAMVTRAEEAAHVACARMRARAERATTPATPDAGAGAGAGAATGVAGTAFAGGAGGFAGGLAGGVTTCGVTTGGGQFSDTFVVGLAEFEAAEFEVAPGAADEADAVFAVVFELARAPVLDVAWALVFELARTPVLDAAWALVFELACAALVLLGCAGHTAEVFELAPAAVVALAAAGPAVSLALGSGPAPSP